MIKLQIKVQELLDEKGWTQKHLATITGLRTAAISEICNNMRTSINKEHLEKIAEAFELENVNQLVEFKFVD
jgi:transcriptional regulator with XRE-family HTH domain